MQVIAHPAVGMEPQIVLPQCLSDDVIQKSTITLGDENILLVISAKGYVIDASIDMHAKATRHRILDSGRGRAVSDGRAISGYVDISCKCS